MCPMRVLIRPREPGEGERYAELDELLAIDVGRRAKQSHLEDVIDRHAEDRASQDAGRSAAEPSRALAFEDDPALDLYDERWTIHTRSEERPPVKFIEGAKVERSLLSNGCLISGKVINSVLSPGVVVQPGAEVRDSVIMNDTIIEAGAVVERCILDKRVVVGRDAIVGFGDDLTPNNKEPSNLASGITIVGKNAQIPAGTRIGRPEKAGGTARRPALSIVARNRFEWG